MTQDNMFDPIMDSAFCRMLKAVSAAYGDINKSASEEYEKSLAGKCIKNSSRSLSAWLNLSIVGGLARIRYRESSPAIDNCLSIQWMRLFIEKCRESLVYEAGSSDAIKMIAILAGGLSEAKYGMAGIVVSAATLTNIALSVLRGSEMSAAGWTIRFFLLLTGMVFVFSHSGWYEMKRTSKVMAVFTGSERSA